jgi:hypothetical protein
MVVSGNRSHLLGGGSNDTKSAPVHSQKTSTIPRRRYSVDKKRIEMRKAFVFSKASLCVSSVSCGKSIRGTCRRFKADRWMCEAVYFTSVQIETCRVATGFKMNGSWTHSFLFILSSICSPFVPIILYILKLYRKITMTIPKHGPTD